MPLTGADVKHYSLSLARELAHPHSRALMEYADDQCYQLMIAGRMNKSAQEETQTVRTGCSKAEPNIFALPQTPFPGGAGRPKFNQLEMVTTFSYKPSLVKIDARNFELSW